MVKVRALQVCFVDNRLRQAGEIFNTRYEPDGVVTMAVGKKKRRGSPMTEATPEPEVEPDDEVEGEPEAEEVEEVLADDPMDPAEL